MQYVEPGSVLFALALSAGMLLMMELGRRAGARQRARLMDGGAAGLGAVEAAVFGLLGLLIAFTFQGAASRFDARRALIVEEANAVGTAWLRIDLLPVAAQPTLREHFRRYLDSRLAAYDKFPDVDAVEAELLRAQRSQDEIWKSAMAALKEGNPVVVGPLLPALNQMFDIANTRRWAVETHPPGVVFVMLAFLACAASFMAGHGMSGSKIRSWVHSLGFALILALTVFVIMDLEYPRLGLIRVDAFDRALEDVRRSMQ